MSLLNHRIYGEKGPVVIILHGLLGMMDNWHSFAKELSDDFRVITVDQRNHGRSFHSKHFSYSLLARDLANFMEDLELDTAHLIGHSMGGKTVMKFLEDFPEKADKSIIVDMGVKSYPGGHEQIFKALLDVNLQKIENRKDVQTALMDSLNDLPVVLFLMKNLSRTPQGHYNWKANIESLFDSYDKILEAFEPANSIDKEILFVKGGQSNYIANSDLDVLKAIFPKAELKSIDNAGHWVHADDRDGLLEIVKKFLQY